MQSNANSHLAYALTDFYDNVGIPTMSICNLASEQQTGTNTEVMMIIRHLNIKMWRKAETSLKTIKLNLRYRKSKLSGKLECVSLKYLCASGTTDWSILLRTRDCLRVAISIRQDMNYSQEMLLRIYWDGLILTSMILCCTGIKRRWT
jgi:hypothetical protein